MPPRDNVMTCQSEKGKDDICMKIHYVLYAYTVVNLQCTSSTNKYILLLLLVLRLSLVVGLAVVVVKPIQAPT